MFSGSAPQLTATNCGRGRGELWWIAERISSLQFRFAGDQHSRRWMVWRSSNICVGAIRNPVIMIPPLHRGDVDPALRAGYDMLTQTSTDVADLSSQRSPANIPGRKPRTQGELTGKFRFERNHRRFQAISRCWPRGQGAVRDTGV